MLNVQIAFPGGPEMVIILIIVVLIFGAAKLPALARSSGQALRIFKSETRALRNEESEVEGQVVSETETPEASPVERGDDKA